MDHPGMFSFAEKKMIEIVWFEHQVPEALNAWEGVKASY